MTDFKVGDRVAVYTDDGRATGIVNYVGVDKKRGFIDVLLDKSVAGANRYHHKQLRHLDKEKSVRVTRNNWLRLERALRLVIEELADAIKRDDVDMRVKRWATIVTGVVEGILEADDG